MIDERVDKQIQELVQRIESRKEHEYAGATYRDVPDLKEIALLMKENFEPRKEDLNYLFFMDLYLAEKYESLTRMSIAAAYRLTAILIAEKLNKEYHYTEEIMKHLEENFSLLLRDRNFFVDDDCVDCLNGMKATYLLDNETIDRIYQKRMARRRNLKNDPVEMSEAYLEVIDEVEEKIDKLQKKKYMGTCFEIWDLKQQFLAEKGITWTPPNLLNPGVMFD